MAPKYCKICTVCQQSCKRSIILVKPDQKQTAQAHWQPLLLLVLLLLSSSIITPHHHSFLSYLTPSQRTSIALYAILYQQRMIRSLLLLPLICITLLFGAFGLGFGFYAKIFGVIFWHFIIVFCLP